MRSFYRVDGDSFCDVRRTIGPLPSGPLESRSDRSSRGTPAAEPLLTGETIHVHDLAAEDRDASFRTHARQ